METKWEEQERIGTDYMWGASGTPEGFEAVCRWETIYCVNLYVHASAISFVSQANLG